MRRHRPIRIPAFLALLLGISGCDRSQPAESVKRPVAVLYAQPTTEDITDYAEFIGETEACASVEVRSRVSGFLKSTEFEDGADVKRGDLLFQIEDRLYSAELERAEASLAQSKARLLRVEADLRRIEALAGSSAITQEQIDLAAGAYSEAIAQTRIAEGERQIARLNLGYCRVAAPLNGRAGRALVDEGSLVKQDETNLVSIVATDPIEITVDVDERTLLRLRRLVQAGEMAPLREKRNPIQVRLADEASSWHDGTIDFVDNRLDPTTGTIRVRGIVPNPDGLFSPGMFVRVRVQIGPPRKTMLITERAIGLNEGEKFVYVVGPDERARYRPVRTGSLILGRRVIAEGLSSNDRVIVSGIQRVRPNVKVAAKHEPGQKSS